MTGKARYYLTVAWCSQGKRGVFCDKQGHAFARVMEPLGTSDADEILGPFALVLAPQWLLLTKAQLDEYNAWYPLAEFSGKYGYAVKEVA
jgi:hypothetical protein